MRYHRRRIRGEQGRAPPPPRSREYEHSHNLCLGIFYGLVLLVNGPFNDHFVFPFERWGAVSQVPPATNESMSIRLLKVVADPVGPRVLRRRR